MKKMEKTKKVVLWYDNIQQKSDTNAFGINDKIKSVPDANAYFYGLMHPLRAFSRAIDVIHNEYGPFIKGNIFLANPYEYFGHGGIMGDIVFSLYDDSGTGGKLEQAVQKLFSLVGLPEFIEDGSDYVLVERVLHMHGKTLNYAGRHGGRVENLASDLTQVHV